MKIITKNIFKYSSIKYFGLSKSPISSEILKLKLISKRTNFGKFLLNLETLLNGENYNISIYDCNRYGYVSLTIELDNKFQPLQKEIEKFCYRSNY